MNAKKKETLRLKQRFFLWLSCNVAGRFIRLLKKTVKLTIIGDENLQSLINAGGKAIFVVWHGNIIIPIMRHIDDGVVVLASVHGDGEIISNILSSLGYDTIRGSTTREALPKTSCWPRRPIRRPRRERRAAARPSRSIRSSIGDAGRWAAWSSARSA